MQRYMAWDIETCPTDEAMMEGYPEADRPPPGNYSKPDTIAQWREKDRKDWETARIKEYSLSPRTGRIVALSLNYRGQEAINLTALDANDEKALIESALTLMTDKTRVDCLVGFNSRTFDWPFLIVRMFYHRISPYQFVDDRRRWVELIERYSATNLDVRDMVTFGDPRAKGTLDQWAQWAGASAKPTRGEDIYPMVLAGDAVGIAAHCQGDAKRTGVLFERVYDLWVRGVRG